MIFLGLESIEKKKGEKKNTNPMFENLKENARERTQKGRLYFIPRKFKGKKMKRKNRMIKVKKTYNSRVWLSMEKLRERKLNCLRMNFT